MGVSKERDCSSCFDEINRISSSLELCLNELIKTQQPTTNSSTLSSLLEQLSVIYARTDLTISIDEEKRSAIIDILLNALERIIALKCQIVLPQTFFDNLFSQKTANNEQLIQLADCLKKNFKNISHIKAFSHFMNSMYAQKVRKKSLFIQDEECQENRDCENAIFTNFSCEWYKKDHQKFHTRMIDFFQLCLENILNFLYCIVIRISNFLQIMDFFKRQSIQQLDTRNLPASIADLGTPLEISVLFTEQKTCIMQEHQRPQRQKRLILA